MPFLKYRDNDLGLRPSSYPYILERALNHYKIKPAVSICIIINRNIKVMYAHYNSFIFQLTVNSKKVSNEKNINCDILLLIIE